MRQLLNTLFITTQGAYLARDGETVLVRVEQENRLRVPIHTLESIVCFGHVLCSPPLLGMCAERCVSVSFLTEHGQFLARVQGPVRGNVLLRRQQYRLADNDAATATIARSAVLAKVANSRTVLMRAARESADGNNITDLNEAASQLGHLLSSLEAAKNVATIRGLEGDAARLYFGVFDRLITASKDSFFFRDRSRRPPLDNVNALLSFLYTLLAHDLAAALETVGLDPAVGYLHEDRPGRPGLALDLMEELRSFLADRLALSLINRRQVMADGFRCTESGAVLMDDATRKEVLLAWQKRKQEELTHPFLEERIAIGLLPYVQALLLARYVRGDLDAYPSFFWR
jgi:CRISPR-associated protein Cas1